VHALVERVHDVLAPSGRPFEVVLVNDCSPDHTWSAIAALTDQHAFVIGVDLRRNSGQDNAIMAGLHQATGEVVVIMDDDLQHDPADIPRLCAELERGFDVVYANFEHKQQARWKNLGSWAADRLAVWLLGKPAEIYMSPYKAIRREVIEAVIEFQGPFSYIDGILFTITSRIAQIPAFHHRRFAGEGNYDLVRSARVALRLATSFSITPLRAASLVGGVLAAVSFLLGAYFVVETLFWEGNEVPGWPSLIVAVFFLGGVQLLGIGALGEYVGRVFLTLNRRPQFTVREVRGAGRFSRPRA
jgi:undecaprenyl-phosphate 4-deoxy-4-formamido-L-arabinose transferase